MKKTERLLIELTETASAFGNKTLMTIFLVVII